MSKMFGVNISKLIHNNISPGVFPATLIKSTPGTRTPGNLTDGTQPTEASYAARGFIDTQRVKFVNGTQVRDGSKVIVLIGDSIEGLQVPVPGDRITIEGTTYAIPVDGTIDRDPAAAVYTCEVRPL